MIQEKTQDIDLSWEVTWKVDGSLLNKGIGGDKRTESGNWKKLD